MWLAREVWFHRRNHYLSILSTSVALFLVLTVSVLSDSLITEITDRFNSLGTDVTMIDIMDAADRDWFSDILQKKGIDRYGISYSEKWNDMDVVMCDAGLFRVFEFRIKTGRLFSNLDLIYNNNCAVLGHEAYEKLGYPQTGETVDIEGVFYRVCGVLDKEIDNLFMDVDNSIFIPISYCDSADSCRYYIADYDFYLDWYLTRNCDSDNYVVVDQSDTGKAIQDMLQLCKSILMFLAYVAVAVSMIGLFSSMLSGIRERTYEIGIKKALGASDAQIFCQFLLEAMVIMTVSSLISIIGCYGVCCLLKNTGVTDLNILKNSSVLIKTGLFGMACCIYPSRKGSMTAIITALRKQA
ncbi:MAG: ABC transporter permease [Erysipelotrichaceae bacterium]|nr:ABC transporter permease [Erysipelotrichaceae bacterium]